MVRWRAGGSRLQLRCDGGRDQGGHRSQRCGEDDPLQRDHRSLCSDRG
jgi:hypothetical protein